MCLLSAYNEDNRKRTIFSHVFARVLSQGTKFDPEDRSGPSTGQNRLAEVSSYHCFCAQFLI